MRGFFLTSLYEDVAALEQRFEDCLARQTDQAGQNVPFPGSPWHTGFQEDYARAARQSQLQLQTCNLLEIFAEPPSSEWTAKRRYYRDIVVEAKDRAMGQCAMLERMLRRLLEAGETCMEDGRPDEALELYRFGLRLSPEASLLRFGECRALSCLGQESAAQEALNRALESCPVTSNPRDQEQRIVRFWLRRALLAVGNHFFCQKDWVGACMAYEAVLKSDPAYEATYGQLEAVAQALESGRVPNDADEDGLETLPAADSGLLSRFALRNFWSPYRAQTLEWSGPEAAEQVRNLGKSYAIRRRAVQLELELHSPRVMHPDGRGGIYVCDCLYADSPSRLAYVHLRTGACRVLSEERFYTGLWLERKSGRLYGSLTTLGRERACKLDCMDAEGRLLQSVEIDSPAHGSVGGPFRLAEDGLGGLLMLDTRKRRLLRYALDDFTKFQVADLGGWSVTPDLVVAGERILLVCPGQNSLLELPLLFGPQDKPRPVAGPRLLSPYRIAMGKDSGGDTIYYVICSEELTVLEADFRIRFRYKLPPDPVRDICHIDGEYGPALLMIQEMRGISFIESGV